MLRGKVVYSFISAVILLNLYSCTLLGFYAGSKADADRAILEPLSLDEMLKMKTGSPVKVYLREGQVMQGILQGVIPLLPGEYTQRYDSFRLKLKNDKIFPALEDTIMVLQQSRRGPSLDNTKYLFAGFDPNTVRLRPLRSNNDTAENMENLRDIADLRGKRVNLATIKNFLESAKVPLRSEVFLWQGNEMQKIPAEKIYRIDQPKIARSRIMLTVAGLVVDYIVVVSWISYKVFHDFKLGK